MLNGLDLFTGIGGITIALRKWVRPIIYCEIDPYCQSVLLQRMQEGNLPQAPIWDDIRTMHKGELFPSFIDIIYGGFPCQDISVAGVGKGLEGQRSGLFFEMLRLISEIRPRFVFLENVPAITTRGGVRAVKEIASLGYDCRWCVISAASVGALHKRERWFLLAHAKHNGASSSERRGSFGECSLSREKQEKQEEGLGEIKRTGCISSNVADSKSQGLERFGGNPSRSCEKFSFTPMQSENVADPHCTRKLQSEGCEQNEWERSGNICENDCDTESFTSEQADLQTFPKCSRGETWRNNTNEYWPFKSRTHWQEAVSTICRVDDGIPHRVDRLKSLGNSVVPIQVAKAFKILTGLNL